MSEWQTSTNVFKVPDSGDDAVLSSTSTQGDVTIFTTGVRPIRRIEASGITGTYRFLSNFDEAIEIYLAGGNALWIRGAGGSLQFDTDILLHDPNTTFRFNIATTDDTITVSRDVAPSATGGTTELVLTSINTTSVASIAINGVISDYKGPDPNATTQLKLTAGLETASDDHQGTIQLAGLNDYTGPTVVNGATLVFNSIANWDPNGIASALGAPTNATDATIRLGDTDTQDNSGTLSYTGSGHSSNRNFTLRGAGGKIEADATATGPLVLSGTVNSIELGTKTIEHGGDSSSINTFSGVISDGTGQVAVAKTGTTTWVLSGSNTYSGGIAIEEGTLSVSADDNLGDPNGALNFSGGTLRVTGTSYSSTARSIGWQGGGFNVVDPNHTFEVSLGSGGSGDLAKFGAGSLQLTGDNSSDNTTISEGQLRIADGNSLSSNVLDGIIGDNASLSGSVVVDGTDGAGNRSTWDVAQILKVGDRGTGTLDITGGALVTSQFGVVGLMASANGAVTVTGTDPNGTPSTWSNSQNLSVGAQGTGTLVVTGGGAVSSTNGFIGSDPNFTAVVTVDDLNSTWTNSDSLHVGSSGGGTLNITGGGAVSSTFGFIGSDPFSTGVATVDDPNSTWTSESLFVGYFGDGTLNVQAGGVVTSLGGFIGHNSGSIGTATVAGTGSTWNVTSGLYVGGSGFESGGMATVDIETGGSVLVSGTMKVWNPGTVNLQGGRLAVSTIDHTDGGAFNFSGGTLQVDAFNGVLVQNGGTVVIGGSPGVTDISEEYQLNDGTLEIELFAGGISPVAGTDFDQLTADTVTLAGGTLELAIDPNYTPALADAFAIIDTTSGVSGTFDNVLGAYLGGGLGFDVQYNANDVTIEVINVLLGDFDVDGDVDGFDFLLWQTDPSIGALSDWQTNFGMVAPLAAVSAAVPEPNSLLLAVLVSFVRLSCRRRP